MRPLAAVRRFLADEPYRRMPDDELWARFRDHADGDALRAILEKLGGRLSARCRAITGDPGLAEDALQDTLLQLVRHRRKIGSYPQAVAWLYRVTDSRSRMILRGRRRSFWRDGRVAKPEAVADREPSDFEVVTDAVARLPARERQAVELVYLEGMTHEQAAVALGVRRGSVGTYILRGVRRLQSSLGRSETATVALLTTAAAGLGDSWAPARMGELTAAVARPSSGGWLPAGLLAAGVGTAAVVGVALFPRPEPAAPSRPTARSETVADRSLRLFHEEVLPRQLDALAGQSLNGGAVRLASVATYDSRLECWYDIANNYPDGRPFFTARLLLRHQSATGDTQTVMDRYGNGQLRAINPDRFLIFWTDDPVTKREITAPSPPLKQAIAAFGVLPRDEAATAAKADADARFEAVCRPLIGEWDGNGVRWTARWGSLREHFGLILTDGGKGEHAFGRAWGRVDEAGRLVGFEPEYTGPVTVSPDGSRLTLPAPHPSFTRPAD